MILVHSLLFCILPLAGEILGLQLSGALSLEVDSSLLWNVGTGLFCGFVLGTFWLGPIVKAMGKRIQRFMLAAPLASYQLIQERKAGLRRSISWALRGAVAIQFCILLAAALLLRHEIGHPLPYQLFFTGAGISTQFLLNPLLRGFKAFNYAQISLNSLVLASFMIALASGLVCGIFGLPLGLGYALGSWSAMWGLALKTGQAIQNAELVVLIGT